MQKPPNQPETRPATANPEPREAVPDSKLASPETEIVLPQGSERVEPKAEIDAADQRKLLKEIPTTGVNENPLAAKDILKKKNKGPARAAIEHFNRRGSVNLAEAKDLEAAIAEQDRDDQSAA